MDQHLHTCIFFMLHEDAHMHPRATINVIDSSFGYTKCMVYGYILCGFIYLNTCDFNIYLPRRILWCMKIMLCTPVWIFAWRVKYVWCGEHGYTFTWNLHLQRVCTFVWDILRSLLVDSNAFTGRYVWKISTLNLYLCGYCSFGVEC